MDVRGVEVTNQLRSAIRAKLLELGVRYDEELPDYILVMVVNKKSRQQMHEDLHLFLENSTTPFVDWLHDQVLKKLQKVTIPKKKSTREFVPTVVVKQEEERKKKKNSSLIEQLKVKEEPATPKSVNKSPQIKVKHGNVAEPSSPPSPQQQQQQIADKKVVGQIQQEVDAPPTGSDTRATKIAVDEETTPKQHVRTEKIIESEVLQTKRSLEKDEASIVRPEKRMKVIEPPKESTQELEENNISEKRLKSCVNKPKITSVVSVKTRLGVTSPRNKFEVHRDRNDTEHRRQSDKRVERRLYEPINRRDNFRECNDDDTSKRNKDESKNRSTPITMANKSVRAVGTSESNGKSGLVSKRLENSSIKDRLGVSNKLKQKEIVEDTQRNIKNRLGPVKSKFIALGRLGPSSISKPTRPSARNDIFEEDDVESNEETSAGPVRSHIIAVKNTATERIERRNSKLPNRLRGDKGNDNTISNNNDDDDYNNDDGKIIASKVTVTPRPLKPLQPIQKRATQSLLLRAVAEANQSVVKQKNPEPILMEKKPVLKRLKPTNMRTSGQNLAVHFNANKRLVMEKIQVELTTSDTVENNEPEPYVPRAVTDEQMGVVMSLFQRSNDNQKFLVTLNGYNNNVTKEKSYSEDDEERLVMEINDEDELLLSNSRNETFVDNELSLEHNEIENADRNEILGDNENHCSNENVKLAMDEIEEEAGIRVEMGELEEEEELVKKRRKLSPIIYSRSRSQTPDNAKSSSISQIISPVDKRTINAPSIPNDKPRDKCRYWPTCTLGNKCAFLHPKVPCSAFPACKFGDKCAYKHPKCKFGLSCTKLGCAFSHPTQQCKYHPFCTKPGCLYLHPPPPPTAPVETVRAKFTWRRRD